MVCFDYPCGSNKQLHCKESIPYPHHHKESNSLSSILGAINALFNFGLTVGTIAQGWLVDVIGERKLSIYSSPIVPCRGATLITGSVAIGMLITVRLLHGFGLEMLICLVPLYLTEVAPP